jgi:phosphoadenosine phosphosulfate reductase
MIIPSLSVATSDEPTRPWTADQLRGLNERFREQPAESLLRWGLDTFAPDIVLGTGFGPSGVVLIHMLAQVRPETTIFYLDTGLLFAKTYALRDELAARLGVQFTPVPATLSVDEQADAYGSRLWARNPDLCCQLRKVAPLRGFLAGQRAWITGVRRDQSPTRANTGLIEWNKSNQVIKLNPLAYWNEAQVWRYIQAHDLPFNALHEKGYPSLGCVPCTRAIAPGEEKRAGRWSGQAKVECGIHIENGKVQRASLGVVGK